MGQRQNEIDTATAARLLEVHADTLRRWAKAVIGGNVSGSRVAYVRVDVVGRYWFDRAEIQEIRRAARASITVDETA